MSTSRKDMSIEEQYIDKIQHGLQNFKQTSSGYKFQCPYCQPGSRDHKGRSYSLGRLKGNLYHKDRSIKFHCYSCGVHQEFYSFLELCFPPLHRQYQLQREHLGLTGFQTNCPSLKTTLKQNTILVNQPPNFDWQHQAINKQVENNHPKTTHCKPVTPQQQAGLGSALDHQKKQSQKRGLNHQADLWLSTDVWRSEDHQA
jgi:hypothetical protein